MTKKQSFEVLVQLLKKCPIVLEDAPTALEAIEVARKAMLEESAKAEGS